MSRRLALAALRAQPTRPAFSLPSVRLPSARTLGLLVAIAVAAALAYFAARETSLFGVKEVRVSGSPPSVRVEVRQALRALAGTSLVKVDAAAVERRLEELPSVVSASVDRAFPHTLRVAVAPERPLAVIRSSGQAWVVSERGRVVRARDPKDLPPLPRIRLGSATTLTLGATVRDTRVTLPLQALATVPSRFPLAVDSARTADGNLVLMLAGEVELRLGRTEDVKLKLAAAEAVLRSLSKTERQGLAYLDVSLPERPVAAPKSQLDG